MPGTVGSEITVKHPPWFALAMERSADKLVAAEAKRERRRRRNLRNRQREIAGRRRAQRVTQVHAEVRRGYTGRHSAIAQRSAQRDTFDADLGVLVVESFDLLGAP